MKASLVVRTVRLALPLTAALALAACGTNNAPSGGGGGGGGTGSSAPAASATPNQVAASGTVITTKSGPAGTYLADGAGRAVYLWTADSMNKTKCLGACISAWPPVVAKGTVTASGSAVSADLGMITRPSGVKQVTYKGHPLYYFAGDSGPGMTTGQGNNGFGAKWWLVSPAGTAITGAGSGGSAASPGSSSGSGGSSWG